MQHTALNDCAAS